MGELINDGKNGSLCRFDFASLATAIERTLCDEVNLATMGVRARADVLQFEYAEAIATYATGLKQLVGK
jgi:hypothetical protein